MRPASEIERLEQELAFLRRGMIVASQLIDDCYDDQFSEWAEDADRWRKEYCEIIKGEPWPGLEVLER